MSSEVCEEDMNGNDFDITTVPSPDNLPSNTINGLDMAEGKVPSIDFTQPSGPVTLSAAPGKVNGQTKESTVFKTEIEFESPGTVASVEFMLRNRYGGVVPEPGKIVCSYYNNLL